MATDFKGAVFALCKQLAMHPKAQEVSTLIHDISVLRETDTVPGGLAKPIHGDLTQVASYEHAQFLGYLLADEYSEQLNHHQYVRVTRLDDQERSTIGSAHATLRLFLDECLGELRERYPKASILLDPYAKFKTNVDRLGFEPFLTKEDIATCVSAFKSGKLYGQLMANDTLTILEGSTMRDILNVSVALDRQFTEVIDGASEETKAFLRRALVRTTFTAEDLLMASCCYCHALMLSLTLALQMMFDAIIGSDLIVLDNDCIIDMQSHQLDQVYDRYSVLLQGALFSLASDTVGSIALLDCDLPNQRHIKVFGVVYALTVNFAGEFGETSKVSMLSLDGELNRMHRMTDTMLNSPIGKTRVVLEH